MKLTISPKSACFAALAAVAARVFLGLMVDAPTTRNGAWLAAILGGLLAAPWVYCIGRCKPCRELLAVPLALLTALDAASMFAALARSAGYLALDRSPAVVLLLPTGIALAWCVLRNGDAIGYGAMIWARLATALLLIVVLLQWRYYRPLWLRPVLGEGWISILEGGTRTAGWITAAASVLVLPDGPDRRVSLIVPLGGTAVAASLIALQLMMTPANLNGGGWLNRLDTLVCNGRAPLYLQLPMIVFWFAGLCHLLACELFASAALAQRVFKRTDGRPIVLVVVGTAIALVGTDALPKFTAAIRPLSFPIAGLLTAVSMLFKARKGGRVDCASEN